MRLLTINLLTIALLIVGATSASAWRLDVSSNYAGDSSLSASDTVTITLALDSETGTDVALLGIGVIYDTANLSYDRTPSSSTSYLLYTSPRNAYLRAANSCGGGFSSPNAGMGCSDHPTLGDQVQVDFFSSQVGANTGVPTATTGAEVLATLVFHVDSLGAGFDDTDPFVGISITMDPIRSGILQLGSASGGAQPPLTINFVPEPTTAGLSLAALTTLFALRARLRRVR